MGNSSDLKENKRKKVELTGRARASQSPPAALLGAFSSFVAAALNPQEELRSERKPDPVLVQIEAVPSRSSVSIPTRLELEYSEITGSGGLSSARPFRRSLLGIAAGDRDSIFALGDGEVRIFSPGGRPEGSWKAPDQSACLTVSADGTVFFGSPGRVHIYSRDGNRLGEFAAGESGRPAEITAVKICGKEILAADAAARIIRRYDWEGKQLGAIGAHGKIRGFMLPNRFLDMDVDAGGVIRAADPGRHRVTAWNLKGEPLGQFGKFGLRNPEDFVGCCNPVNLAVTPDGKIVTAEKVAARVKVYAAGGPLLAVIGPAHFDPRCTHLHLAVDAKGRILVADPVRLEIKVFSAKPVQGGGELA